MSDPPQHPRLPEDPLTARQRAEHLTADGDHQAALVWALLAVAGELHTIRRQLKGR
ncbi:hypothetical protein [Streptomyces sp. C10-9-1]|uniref:hypothetical protein n=1 Tax=Streptomyces sp. C10-9-1 TaxID=1859285 RepID=UPI003F49EC94